MSGDAVVAPAPGEDVFIDYDFPPELVAQSPAERRDEARLLVVDRAAGSFTHDSVAGLGSYLRPGDLLVVNDTKVVSARLLARKPTGGRIELLVLEWGAGPWRALVKGSVRPGQPLLVDGSEEPLTVATVEGGMVTLTPPGGDPLAFLERHGRVPLPPYIHRSADAPIDEMDRRRYQTVYARDPGSVAAPTAGLHFTPELLDNLRAAGIETAVVTLHVGWGTFSPISGDWRGHRLHSERTGVSGETARAVNSALAEGRRVVAVGTTAVRVLESRWDEESGGVTAGEGSTELYITPGRPFKVVGALFTNFHRPRSSLLLLVDAFAGSRLVERAYAEAIARRYRLFSYGDAMLLV